MIMKLDNIFRRRLSAVWVCLGLAVVLALFAVQGNLSYAQGRFLREEWKLPKFYPRGFDGYGQIEKIAQDSIVIGDTTWKFSHPIRFATPRDPNAVINAFSAGDTVAYLLNEKREITSLWYIEFRNR